MALEAPGVSLKQALAELSQPQREAVEWRDGSMLVLAVPGAGKTRVLTCRIAQILESSSDESFRLLALTFTNKAADEMRQRITQYAPGHENRLFLGTFHGFCAEVLRNHGSHLGVKPDFKIYSAREDVLAVLEEVVRELGRAQPRNLERTLSVLDRLRAALISPDQVPEVIPDPSVGARLAAVYRAYEAKLRDLNALDFNSLLYYANRLLSKATFAKHYRRVYRYWCVDEFQDTNQAQYRLLQTMAGDSFRSLFVVADDDQVIYEWNGASHRRIEEFQTNFQARLLQLPTNYRCPAPIVELANRLISHNQRRTPGKARLEAGKVSECRPDVVRLLPPFSTEEAEQIGIVEDVLGRRLPLGRVSILARNRTLLDQLQTAFEARDVAVTRAQRRDEFVSPHFRWLQACLVLASDPCDRRSLRILLGGFEQLTGIGASVEDVMTRAEVRNGNFLQEWAESVERDASPSVGDIQKVVVQHLLDGCDFREFTSSALAWLESLRPDDPQAYSDYQEDRSAWLEMDRALRDRPLSTYLQELDMRSKAPSPKPDSVALWTIHAAKGCEFDHVYLIGMADGVLPSYRALEQGSQSVQLEEERRGCFVAITRTQQTLTLTYAKTYRGWTKQPSRFLAEMGLDPE